MAGGLNFAALLNGMASEATTVKQERLAQEQNNFLQAHGILQSLISDPRTTDEVRNQAGQAALDMTLEHMGYNKTSKTANPVRKFAEQMVGQQPNNFSQQMGQVGVGRGNAKTSLGTLPPAGGASQSQAPAPVQGPASQAGSGMGTPLPQGFGGGDQSGMGSGMPAPTGSMAPPDNTGQPLPMFNTTAQMNQSASDKIYGDTLAQERAHQTAIVEQLDKLDLTNPTDQIKASMITGRSFMPFTTKSVAGTTPGSALTGQFDKDAFGNAIDPDTQYKVETNQRGIPLHAYPASSTLTPQTVKNPDGSWVHAFIDSKTGKPLPDSAEHPRLPAPPPFSDTNTTIMAPHIMKAADGSEFIQYAPESIIKQPNVTPPPAAPGSLAPTAPAKAPAKGGSTVPGAPPRLGPRMDIPKAVQANQVLSKEQAGKLDGQIGIGNQTIGILNRLHEGVTNMPFLSKVKALLTKNPDGVLSTMLAKTNSPEESRLAGDIENGARSIMTLRGPLDDVGFRNQDLYKNIQSGAGSMLANPVTSQTTIEQSLRELAIIQKAKIATKDPKSVADAGKMTREVRSAYLNIAHGNTAQAKQLMRDDGWANVPQ